jgi:ATP-dependent Clp protease ATP-binding subunit ClpC
VHYNFSDTAQRTMGLAQRAAAAFDHEHFGTEHALWALADGKSGMACLVLRKMGIEPARVRQDLERLMGVKRGASPGDFRIRRPPTPGMMALLDTALEEARLLGDNYIGTEHLLLALIREKDGLAGQVLRDLQVDVCLIRREIKKVVSDYVVEESRANDADKDSQKIRAAAPIANHRAAPKGFDDLIRIKLVTTGMNTWARVYVQPPVIA